jgi:hypothetical protein
MAEQTGGGAGVEEQARRKRQPDGPIFIEDNGTRLANRVGLACILHVTPLTISGWTKLPDGLPFIRPPSANPKRKGLRMMFDVAAALAWFKSHSEKPNPTRKGRRTSD